MELDHLIILETIISKETKNMAKKDSLGPMRDISKAAKVRALRNLTSKWTFIMVLSQKVLVWKCQFIVQVRVFSLSQYHEYFTAYRSNDWWMFYIRIFIFKPKYFEYMPCILRKTGRWVCLPWEDRTCKWRACEEKYTTQNTPNHHRNTSVTISLFAAF